MSRLGSSWRSRALASRGNRPGHRHHNHNRCYEPSHRRIVPREAGALNLVTGVDGAVLARNGGSSVRYAGRDARSSPSHTPQPKIARTGCATPTLPSRSAWSGAARRTFSLGMAGAASQTSRSRTRPWRLRPPRTLRDADQPFLAAIRDASTAGAGRLGHRSVRGNTRGRCRGSLAVRVRPGRSAGPRRSILGAAIPRQC